jgi:ArsR family transcriptional regulator
MDFEYYSQIFKALAHPIRLQIACGLMTKNECNVSKMVEKLGVSQPMVSQHLNILKNAGIIQNQRKGTQICYRVVNKKVESIIKSMEINLCE